ncbi:MAG: hypothetical protein PHR56_04430 [Dehalococcoidales bacterium]|nr:hypothetical protein [Dehalococcoidales bacterium]
MDKLYEKAETGCCPRFNPEPWNEKEVTLADKLFIKDHVTSFFHIPLNFGKVITRNMEIIKQADALTADPLMLYDDKSLWGGDVYIAVDKELSGVHAEKVTGNFLAKVFEGSFKETGKWISEMNKFVESKGKKSDKMYFFYTTCPKCAEYYGKNYTVLLARV